MCMALTAVTNGAWTWDFRNQQLCRWSLGDGLVEISRTQIPHKPDVEEIIPVSRDEVWIQTPVRGEDRTWRYDRIDARGRRIGSYWHRRIFDSSIRIHGDRPYQLGMDQNGAHQITVARMREPV
ncbi:hypothetical protein ACFL6R_07615 [Gemmatimonadota bacterium]